MKLIIKLILGAICIFSSTITLAQDDTSKYSGGVFYYMDEGDYYDTLDFNDVKVIQDEGIISILTSSETSSILIQQKEFFFIVIENKYYSYGIHNWEFRHEIYQELIKI